MRSRVYLPAFGVYADELKGLHLRAHDRITVCERCKRTSCWEGALECRNAEGARSITISVAQARELRLEHPSFWVTLRRSHGYPLDFRKWETSQQRRRGPMHRRRRKQLAQRRIKP